MSKEIVGKRIAVLRKQAGLTQAQMVEKYNEFINNNGTQMTPVNISSYEAGHRTPTLKTVMNLALFFNTTMDYLMGLTDVYEQKGTSEGDSKLLYLEPERIIPQKQLNRYDGQPVFVIFPDGVTTNKWGILDYHNERIVFKDEVYKLNPSLKIYNSISPLKYTLVTPDSNPISLGRLLNCELVKINMITSDAEAIGKYNGWYRHNEDHTMLINCANGLTLPYCGIGISYNAFEAE